jgi:hypothetical protein
MYSFIFLLLLSMKSCYSDQDLFFTVLLEFTSFLDPCQFQSLIICKRLNVFDFFFKFRLLLTDFFLSIFNIFLSIPNFGR